MFFRRLVSEIRRNPPLWLGALLLTLIAISAIGAPLWHTVDPTHLNPAKRLLAPGAEAWFGTDMLGRDVWSRTLYGGRISLIVAVTVAVITGVAGLFLGMVASFLRGTDGVIMRVMDGLMSIPPILLAIAMMALTGPSLMNILFVITITEIPRVTRVVRAHVLSLREKPFVEAAITMNTTLPMLLWRHILPNIIAPVMVQLTFVAASAMITESMLSFLGAGVPPEIPSWGNVIADGQLFFQIHPSLILFPGILLSLTVLGITLLGNGFNRRFLASSR
ncbi:ABC transporter permease [Celeribacter persicus]|uniref:Peptide/nickel transport system permease protein n=1 Tax=Celeribacter persicus TaxID=1651082 RepID=A0A2T5HUN1_9RHOB|nr:ABC transporter permease [Celeribacter persicus]PTQ75300.1 peptide/nickel transport system permease protein [Celeribacter persicus]